MHHPISGTTRTEELIISAAINALAHAVEAYTSTIASSLTRNDFTGR